MPRGAALLLIDIQQGFDSPVWGARNNPDAEQVAAALLAAWRRAGWPIVHVQHDSTEPGSPLATGQPGHRHKPEVAPAAGEPVVHKTVNSGFIGTDLEQRLRATEAPGVVQVVHEVALASLHGEFATVVDSAAVLATVPVGPA